MQEGAAFAVTGEATMTTVADRKQRVEIQWRVSRRDGHDLGLAAQINEVPAGTLNGLWGDVAYVVAEEAAAAVRDIIANAGGLGEAAARRPEPAPEPQGVAQPASQPGPAGPQPPAR